MGIVTALGGGLFGLLNALLPDIIGWFRRRQEAAERERERQHELALMEKQADIQIRLGQQRLEEARFAADAEVMRSELSAFAEQMRAIYKAQEPVGIRWVDAWNASLRPAAVTVALAILTLTVTIYVAAVLSAWWIGMIPSADIVDVMFKGLVGEFIQAVVGYLFGYRGGMHARRLAAQ
ncbi:MAG: hypothetical protein HY057_11285 [Rhodospirillales bacterium]|nr:hypothetical protein [Rhodospirillales bacterium]